MVREKRSNEKGTGDLVMQECIRGREVGFVQERIQKLVFCWSGGV